MFRPKCLVDEIQIALTNRGHLIPCCWCDEEWSLKTPEFQKLLKVSKISEVEEALREGSEGVGELSKKTTDRLRSIGFVLGRRTAELSNAANDATENRKKYT